MLEALSIVARFLCVALGLFSLFGMMFIGHIVPMMAAGVLDPTPLVTHHMPLADAPEAYAVYDRREALKIVMKP